ncbi:hypothetical protein AJ79_01145 [Helicocarpus griseus UAMH5409]|uniref:Uncharacterized protein n=1 Tax=Helicocarpus griseus UAMH5409 TaxID=1447875 RepID=A0A2B7Y8H8_9EURO|nr:hypothetical protein AJ79_01145 [Helicocarpus griseus UAMH5409]
MLCRSRLPASSIHSFPRPTQWRNIYTRNSSSEKRIGFQSLSSRSRESNDGTAKAGQSSATEPNLDRPRFDAEKISLQHADLLKTFGLGAIPESNDTGAEINDDKRIVITSEAKSRQRHKTALVLSCAPSSLDERDFLAILDRGKYLDGWKATSGLEQIIPMRYANTLRRSHTWILLFSNPSSAKAFQDKVYSLSDFVRKSLPTAPFSNIIPPPNYTKPGTRDHRLSDYTLTTPWLQLSLYAFLSPFDKKIQRAIDLHNNLASRGSDGKQGFPVRLWLDKANTFPLKKEYVHQLLSWDGQNRWAPWQLVEGEGEAITPLTAEPLAMANEMLASPGEDEEDDGKGTYWRIGFQTAAEARRFVRVWHRSVFPKLRIDSMPYYPDPPPLIKAECLFEGDLL